MKHLDFQPKGRRMLPSQATTFTTYLSLLLQSMRIISIRPGPPPREPSPRFCRDTIKSYLPLVLTSTAPTTMYPGGSSCPEEADLLPISIEYTPSGNPPSQ